VRGNIATRKSARDSAKPAAAHQKNSRCCTKEPFPRHVHLKRNLRRETLPNGAGRNGHVQYRGEKKSPVCAQRVQ